MPPTDFTFVGVESCQFCNKTFTEPKGSSSPEERRIDHEVGCDAIEPAENVEPLDEVVDRWDEDLRKHHIQRPLEAALRDRFETHNVKRNAVYHPYNINLVLRVDGKVIAISVGRVTASPHPTDSLREQVESYVELGEFDDVILFEPYLGSHDCNTENIDGARFISDMSKFETWDDLFDELV